MSINNNIYLYHRYCFFTSDTGSFIPLHLRLAWAVGVLLVGLSFAYFCGNAERILPESVSEPSIDTVSYTIPAEVEGTLISTPLDYKPDSLLRTVINPQTLIYTNESTITMHRVQMPINTSPEIVMSPNYPAPPRQFASSTLTEDGLVPPRLDPQSEKLLSRGFIRHRTVNGDSLHRLAELYFKDASRWEEIYKINASQLTNKDVVPIGIVLLIPYPEQ